MNEQARKGIGSAQITAAFVLGGSSVPIGKLLVGSLPPFTLSLLSLACGLIFLAPALMRRLPALRRARPRDILLICVQGLLGMALFRVFMLKGLSLTSAVHAGVISSFGPALMGLASVLILGDRSGPRTWIGLALGTAGIVLLRVPTESGASMKASVLGDLLVFAAIACEALMSLIKKKCGEKLDALGTSSVIVMASLVFTLPLAALEWMSGGFPAIGLREALGILYYGAVATALAYFFWAAGSSKVSGSVIALAMVAMPLSSVILSVVFLRERPGLPALLGLGLGLIGMVVGQIPMRPIRACGEEAGRVS